MRVPKRIVRLFKRRPKTAEEVAEEARALAAQREFELTKARYRNR